MANRLKGKGKVGKKDRFRKGLFIGSIVLFIAFTIVFALNIRLANKTDENAQLLANAKENTQNVPKKDTPAPLVAQKVEEEVIVPPVLEMYEELLKKNKNLVGWIKVDGTVIDYPVLQTTNNEYYLNKNFENKDDKNGAIFMDKDCDIVSGSTNYILYGHHMKSGKMFAGLEKYVSSKFQKQHPFVYFDTIYETGKYEVMYVFRSKVYSSRDVVFKYYQFIDAFSELEFNSNMKEMAEMSIYDTGVTAVFGDELLTLSTCDYEETNGRFVVVAKKVYDSIDD